MEKLAEIGVFGGSGFYKFLEDIEEVKIETPYGMPSDSLFIGSIGKHRVAFMPRHGRNHTILPHLINFRANVWAMKEIGCTRVISPCAAGSLQKHVEPGHFVVCDQFAQHWVVITGFAGGSLSASNFIINDPGTGSRTNLQQFLNAYPTFYKFFYY